MRLSDEEDAMGAGAMGPVRRWAIEHQVAVGAFFDAENLVPVGQASPAASSHAYGYSDKHRLDLPSVISIPS